MGITTYQHMLKLLSNGHEQCFHRERSSLQFTALHTRFPAQQKPETGLGDSSRAVDVMR